jgi:hypothetical protein
LRPVTPERQPVWHKGWILVALATLAVVLVVAVMVRTSNEVNTAEKLTSVDRDLQAAVERGDFPTARDLSCGTVQTTLEAVRPNPDFTFNGRSGFSLTGGSPAMAQTMQTAFLHLTWQRFSIHGDTSTAVGVPSFKGMPAALVARLPKVQRTFEKVDGRWLECESENLPR